MTHTSVKEGINHSGSILAYYPEFATLTDPEMIRALVAELLGSEVSTAGDVGEVKILRSRFSPSSGIIVSFEVTLRSPQGNEKNGNEQTTKQFYIYGAMAEGFEKLRRLIGRFEPLIDSICPTPFLIERNHAVLCEFPADLKLPDISILADMERFHELVSRQLNETQMNQPSKVTATGVFETLRYKPHSRLVGEYRFKKNNKDSCFIIRFHREEFGRRMYRFLRAIHSQFMDESSPAIPKPLFWLPEISAFAIERVNGETLANLLKTNRATETVSIAGGTLGRFHRNSSPTGHELSYEQFDDSLKKALDILNCCGDLIGHRVDAIKKELSRLADSFTQGHPGLVHGDFHQGQLLYDDERVWLLDFDRCHLGDQSTDVGNFLAQLTLLGIRGRIADEKELRTVFLDGYRVAGGNNWPREQIQYYYCQGLLELAAKEIRRLKPDFQSSVVNILDVVESTIGEL